MKYTHTLCELHAEPFIVKIIAMVVLDIIIVIVCYHLYAGNLQLYS